MRLLAIITLLISATWIPADTIIMEEMNESAFAKVETVNNRIKSGEKLTYDASFEMSGLNTVIAQVAMETSTVNTSNAQLLRLKCSAQTYSQWDSFFKIRDLYESYVNPRTLDPYLHKRSIDEGGYKKAMKYKFNRSTGIVEATLTKKGKDRPSNVQVGANTVDVISMLYQVRAMDFEHWTVGQTKTLTVLFDKKENTGTIKYLGKETIQNGAYGAQECFKLAIGISDSDVLQGNNKNIIYISTHESHAPVKVLFNIAVGRGELNLTSYTQS